MRKASPQPYFYLGSQSSGTVVNNISEAKHKFFSESVKGDGSCFFWSLKYLLHFLKIASTQHLREITAYFIEKNENLHAFIPEPIEEDEDILVKAPVCIEKCNRIDNYCSQIRKKLYAGEPEYVATAALYQKQIIVIVMNDKGDKSFGRCDRYGDEKLSECIYLQLDESSKHFEPLYISNKKNRDEKIKVFPCNNSSVQKLLKAYIEEKRRSN